jgi:hypothetical protein
MQRPRPVYLFALTVPMNTAPVSINARTPELTEDSMRPMDVSICRLTLWASGTVPRKGFAVQIGTQIPVAMPSPLQITK